MEPTTLQFTPPAMRSGGPPGFPTPHDTHNPVPTAANDAAANTAPLATVLPVNTVHNGAPQPPANSQAQISAEPAYEYVRVRTDNIRPPPQPVPQYRVPQYLQPQPGTQFAPSGPSTAFIHPVRNFGPASVHSTNVPGIPGPAPSTFQPQMYYAPAGSPILSGQHPPVHTVPQHQSASFSFAPTVRDMHFGHAPAGSAILSGGGPGPPHGTSQYPPGQFPPVSQNFAPHHLEPHRILPEQQYRGEPFGSESGFHAPNHQFPDYQRNFGTPHFYPPHANQPCRDTLE